MMGLVLTCQYKQPIYCKYQNKFDTLLETFERHTPNDEYKNLLLPAWQLE